MADNIPEHAPGTGPVRISESSGWWDGLTCRVRAPRFLDKGWFSGEGKGDVVASCPEPLRRRIARFFAFLALVLLAADAWAQDKSKIAVVPQIPHSNSVTSVAFSPDGARGLSGSKDATVKLWDVSTGRLLRTFEGHAKGVTSVAFSPTAHACSRAARTRR